MVQLRYSQNAFIVVSLSLRASCFELNLTSLGRTFFAESRKAAKASKQDGKMHAFSHWSGAHKSLVTW